MIERFYLQEYLSFKEAELNFSPGLIVFTGPSGSGKSILLSSILSSLGVDSCDAALCESSVAWAIEKESLYNQNDLNIFKHIKKENSRYFINNQAVSKKSMYEIASNYLRHLSLKDFSDFENENLLEILDTRVALRHKKFPSLKEEYKTSFKEFLDVQTQLYKIMEEEKKIVELKEFTAFEIKKIEDINPKESEDEELLSIKKELSRKEKVVKNIEQAYDIFNYEHYAFSALESLEVDSSFISDAMNELRATFDNAQEKFSALDEIDIEEVLNRIEALSGIKRRYGSIKEALEYKEQKKIELMKYENIEIEKSGLEEKYKKLEKSVDVLANELSILRSNALDSFNKDLNSYLKELYLRDANVKLEKVSATIDGVDKLEILLNNTPLQKISTGEFNRLRLAVLALKAENMSSGGGVLMLDEIDANLSGEESMSVAKVLRKLSQYFQIFVISHQPQLTSMGNQHFLVYKKGNESFVKELDFESRIDEIARIISGDIVSNEAKEFAKELLGMSRQCA